MLLCSVYVSMMVFFHQVICIYAQGFTSRSLAKVLFKGYWTTKRSFILCLWTKKRTYRNHLQSCCIMEILRSFFCLSKVTKRVKYALKFSNFSMLHTYWHLVLKKLRVIIICVSAIKTWSRALQCFVAFIVNLMETPWRTMVQLNRLSHFWCLLTIFFSSFNKQLPFIFN